MFCDTTSNATEDPDAVDVAADPEISARTLAQRLAKAGISYAEPANFSRTFKRWHGVAPRTLRQRFLAAS